jgi:hypothetical protein
MKYPETMPAGEVRAEWVRAVAFVVVTAGLLVVALALPDETFWLVTGLLVLVVGAFGLVWAALRLPIVRQLFGGLFRWQPAVARSALVDLNRVPASPAPHRRPRLVALVFGPLSAAAAMAVVVRLLTT